MVPECGELDFVVTERLFPFPSTYLPFVLRISVVSAKEGELGYPFAVNNVENERGVSKSARKRELLLPRAHILLRSRSKTRSMARGLVPILRARLTRDDAVDQSAGLSRERTNVLFVGGPRRMGQTVPGALGWLPICRRLFTCRKAKW